MYVLPGMPRLPKSLVLTVIFEKQFFHHVIHNFVEQVTKEIMETVMHAIHYVISVLKTSKYF
jgi:hypothetical protein